MWIGCRVRIRKEADSTASCGVRPRARSLTVDEMPRFFRHQDRVYLLGPMKPVSDKPGDLGNLSALWDRPQLHRACLFDAHMPTARFIRSGPGSTGKSRHSNVPRDRCLPTGRLCAGVGDAAARTLGRPRGMATPGFLDRRRPAPGGSERRANCPLHAQSRADRPREKSAAVNRAYHGGPATRRDRGV